MSAKSLRRVAALGPFLCLLSAGCIPFVPLGVAWPSVSHVAPVQVQAPADQVRVFRVDCVRKFGPSVDGKAPHTLTEVPLEGSTVPAQLKVALDTAYIWNCLALIYSGGNSHTLFVRLYRSGWQTVELASWESGNKVAWQPARTLAQRETAVDDLVSTWDQDRLCQRAYTREARPQDERLFSSLVPGSASAGHAKALLCAAGEYDRLAEDPEADDRLRQRTADKARHLRERAEK